MKGLTLKENKFVEITAKTLNPTQAVRETYQLGSKGGSKTKEQECKTASIMAMENLGKPRIKKALVEKIADNIDITSIHQRNIKQNKNLPASNQALDMYYKLSGDYTPDKKIIMNISPDNIDKLIKDKLTELKTITGGITPIKLENPIQGHIGGK